MVKVLEMSEDVTEKHNQDNSRWIIFNEDSTFVSGSARKKRIQEDGLSTKQLKNYISTATLAKMMTAIGKFPLMII